jgi:ankyrin repeat protein
MSQMLVDDGDEIRQLISAIRFNDIDLACKLIASGVAQTETTPLFQCASFGRVEIIAMLLDAGVPIDAVNNVKQSACHVAIQYGHFDVLQLLVSRGANVHVFDRQGCSLLTYALRHAEDKFAIVLLDAGAPIRLTREDGRHMLDRRHCAAEAASQSVQLLARLLARNINLGVVRNWRGLTPLHLLSSRGRTTDSQQHFEAHMRMLVNDAKCDVNALGVDGCSALDYAIMGTDDKIVRILCELGADMDRPNIFGFTPLHVVSAKGDRFVPCTIMLLAAGANFHLLTRGGETACHRAAGAKLYTAQCARWLQQAAISISLTTMDTRHVKLQLKARDLRCQSTPTLPPRAVAFRALGSISCGDVPLRFASDCNLSSSMHCSCVRFCCIRVAR